VHTDTGTLVKTNNGKAWGAGFTVVLIG